MNEFFNRMKNSKVLTILVSVLIACIVWIYVDAAKDPDINDVIRNVPIVITGQSVLEERGLMITEQSADDIDLRVTGKRDALVNLNANNIPVLVDVSTLMEVGSHDLLCVVTLPSSLTGGAVTVNNRETYRVTVTVEERISKTVEIKGMISGSVAKGYQAGEFILSPNSIEISGPAGLLNSIEYARVDLTGSNLKETYSGLLPIELVSINGEIIGIDKVECEASSVYTVCPIMMVRELDLAVELLAGGGAAKEHVSCEIFPETITVSGDEKDLADLDEFLLGKIDLAEIAGDSVMVLPIELPDGLTNESGEAEAKVTVKFNGLTTKTLEVTRFNLKNVPEGYVAGMISTAVQVVVRGPADKVAEVRAGQLYAEVDLSGIASQEGEIEVPVKVVLEQADGVGVVGTNYSVRVALTR